MNRVLENKEYKITQHAMQKNVVTGNTHYGVDIHAIPENGDYIVAHSDGVIEWLVNNHNTTDTIGGSLGNYVGIRHANGYMTLYCHLAPDSICVSKGQNVKKGQRIGYMGQTGRATGVHLHFEVRKPGNVRINPEEYLDNDLPDLPTNAQNNENIVQNTPEKDPECTITDNFEVGDKVLVLNGVASYDSAGNGPFTAEYHGIPEEGDIKYITWIENGASRPYHLSNEPLNGRQVKDTQPRGWVSAEQIKKI